MTYPLLATAQGWCPWCGGHMSGWGGWGMMLGWLLILVLVVVAIVWAVGRARAPGGGTGAAPGPAEDPAEAVVREQYARGVIDEETYRRRLEELRRGRD